MFDSTWIYLDQVSPQWDLQTKIELQKEKMIATVECVGLLWPSGAQGCEGAGET